MSIVCANRRRVACPRSRLLSLLLSTALTGSLALVAVPPGARAGCDANTSGTSVCSGSSAGVSKEADGDLVVQFNNQTVTSDGVSIMPSTAVSTPVDVALSVVSATAGNTITGANYGIQIGTNTGGNVAVTTVVGATVSATNYGIQAWTSDSGTITIITNDAITAGGTGIETYTAGSGRTSITANADISATGMYAIAVNNPTGTGETELDIGQSATIRSDGSGYAGAIYVTGGGDLVLNQNGTVVSPGMAAISTSMNGTSASTLNINGNVTGSDNAVVYASTEDGTNRINLTGGTIVGGSAGDGVKAVSSGDGDVVVSMTGGTVLTGNGLRAVTLHTSGSGDAVMTMTGGQIGTNADRSDTGISATTTGTGNISVTTAAPIFASAKGIEASAEDGTVDVASGPIDVTGSSDAAIWATTTSSGHVFVTVNGLITAAGGGVFAATTADDQIAVTANADIRTSGTGSAAIETVSLVGGATTITVADGVTVGSGTTGWGIRANNYMGMGSGPVAITNSGTIAGVVGIETGAGASSTVTNSGTITGTGGTAISFLGTGNTLILDTTSVINGNVVGSGGDALELAGTGSGALDVAQYQGFGTIAKSASSTWTLSGTNTATMTANVTTGTLVANATLANTDFVVTGGTLMGSGTIGSLAMNGGVVAPGNSIGTLGVSGPVSFASGSTYRVEVDDAGQSDKITTSGAATLNGGSVVVHAVSGSYAATNQYTILTAAGGLTGTFAGVTSDLAFYTAALTYGASDVYLTLTGNSASFDSVAVTANQHGVAGALDAGPASGTLAQAVRSLSTADVRRAFDALSGEIHPSVAGVIADETSYMRQAMFGRMREFGATGARTGGGPVLAYADAMPVKAHPLATKADPVTDARTTWWTQGFGSWGTSESDGNAASLSRRIGGVATGVDTPLANGWRAGIAGGYSQSTVNGAAASGSATVDTAHLGAYAGGPLGLGFNLRTGAAAAWHTIDSERTAAFTGFSDHDTARYDAVTGQVFGEIGHAFTLAAITVEPFAGLTGVFQHVDGFSETGGAAALVAEGHDDGFGYTSLGLRAAAAMNVAGTDLVPYASAAWQHAFGDVAPTTAFTLASTGAAFAIDGLPLARDTAFVEAGADLRVRADITLGLAYAGRFGETVTDNTVRGRFAWQF
jgi:outer membrane autotransporter protein